MLLHNKPVFKDMTTFCPFMWVRHSDISIPFYISCLSIFVNRFICYPWQPSSGNPEIVKLAIWFCIMLVTASFNRTYWSCSRSGTFYNQRVAVPAPALIMALAPCSPFSRTFFITTVNRTYLRNHSLSISSLFLVESDCVNGYTHIGSLLLGLFP